MAPANCVQVVVWRINGRGINRTISISNTIKIIANRKNRNENGIRAVWFGSNPHSKGELFSRSSDERIDKIVVASNTIIGRISDSNIAIIIADIS